MATPAMAGHDNTNAGRGDRGTNVLEGDLSNGPVNVSYWHKADL